MTIIDSFLNPSSRWFYPLRWLVLILLGLVIYTQTFGFSFVFDDNFFVLDNPYIRSLDHLDQIWSSLPKTRLVGIYSFVLNYQLFGANPSGYHVFNFVIHLIVTGLVWALAGLLFEMAGLAFQGLPFLIAVLFLVHPCQTEAVSYISQRFESMATMFYLGSIYAYLLARLDRSNLRKIVLFVLCILSAVFGILTKEIAVTIPLMILAVEFILLKKRQVKSTNTRSKQQYMWIALLGFLFLLFFIRIVRTNFNIYFHFSAPSESHDGDIVTAGRYLLTQARVFLTFLRLLIWPLNLNVDYDYPLSTGLLTPPLTLFGFSLIGLIIFLIFKWRQQFPLIAFGLAWILITFSVNTAPRVNVIFEHKLYLISFGFFLVMVCVLLNIIKDRKRVTYVLLASIFVLSVLSCLRNQVWQSEFTLWKDVSIKSVHKARPFNSLGVFYGGHGDYRRAVDNFNQAIALKPDYAEAYNNRGNTFLKLEQDTKALFDLNKAIDLKPDYAQAYYNRGLLYHREGRDDRAISDLSKAIQFNVNHAPAFFNRGLIYLKAGQVAIAINDFNQAIAIYPQYADVYANRALAYYLLKEYDNALADVYKAQMLGAVLDPRFILELKQVLPGL